MVDEGGVEMVEAEMEVGESGGNGGVELKERMAMGGGEEVEEGVLRAGGVLENGEYGGDGSTEVRGGVV